MSHLMGTVQCYDVFDRVAFTWHVWDADVDRDSPHYESRGTEMLVGEGISDQRQWLKDALIAVVEGL